MNLQSNWRVGFGVKRDSRLPRKLRLKALDLAVEGGIARASHCDRKRRGDRQLAGAGLHTRRHGHEVEFGLAYTYGGQKQNETERSEYFHDVDQNEPITRRMEAVRNISMRKLNPGPKDGDKNSRTNDGNSQPRPTDGLILPVLRLRYSQTRHHCRDEKQSSAQSERGSNARHQNQFRTDRI